MQLRIFNFNKLIGDEKSDRRFIFEQTSGSFAIRIFYKVVNTIMAILLARILTVEEYGIYTLAFTWAFMVTTPALIGVGRLAARELANLHILEEWQYIRGFLEWSFRTSILTLLLSTGIFIAGVFLFISDENLKNAFLVAALLIPAFGLVRLLKASTEGVKVIALGRIPDSVIQPVIYILAILLIHFYVPIKIHPVGALLLYALSTYVISIVGALWILFRSIPTQVWLQKGKKKINEWRSRAAPFLLISILNVADVRLATILLGFWSSRSDVALFNVASRGTDVISFVLFAFGAPITRVGLQAFLDKQPAKLQRVITRSVWLMLLIALPVAICFIFFGKPILSIFGKEYIAAYGALIILTVGELVSVLSGNLGELLSASGFEWPVSRLIAISLGVNLLLGYLLIPRYFLLGAAIGETTSLAIRNIGFLILAKRKLNIQIPFLVRW